MLSRFFILRIMDLARIAWLRGPDKILNKTAFCSNLNYACLWPQR